MSKQPLNISICGSGAMGCLFGASLVKAGNNVLFYDAWPVLLEEMKTRSTAVLITPEGEEEIPVSVHAMDDSKVDVPADLVIITVKSPMTAQTIKTAMEKGMIGPETVVLTLQGGFDNVDIIAEHTKNPKYLLYGRTCCSCKPAGIMKITNFALAATTVWPLGTGKDEEPVERVKDVVNRVNESGLAFELTNEAIPDRWKMLLYYLTNIAVSAIVHLDFKTCWENEDGKDALVNLSKECALVAKHEGVDVTKFNDEIAIEAVRKLAQEECPKHMGSMFADMTNKRLTENEATLGAMLKFAAKHGLDLPYTRLIHALIGMMEKNYDKMQ